jgi:DNA-binding MarR family transcriptional regulator/N-acetylglutamate synthase-like GNAT family acetyltransferase
MTIALKEIDAVRAFNRDYTRRIGVLSQRHLGSRYTLTQARVLYEIAHRPGVLAVTLASELGLDRGYLSRILKKFTAERLLGRSFSGEDARRQHLRLTPLGRRAFAPLQQRARREIRALLAPLDGRTRQQVLRAMQTIRRSLDAGEPRKITLRAHRPGDMGWVVGRHGALYHEEFGWTQAFEALVAQITAEFIRNFDPARERCWIAESHGRRVGSVFLVAGEAHTAQLRLLLVEPEARGAGLGARLINECIGFARQAGYRQLTLWTQANLAPARHLYEQAGFVRTRSEAHTSFGHDLVGETWSLDLQERGSVPAVRRSVAAAKR